MAIDNLARSIGAAFRQAGGSGGKEIVPLEVTENGTYQEEGKAYSPVTVNVPNTYSQEDEGKVVSNGVLVGQTSIEITENGTIDTTLNNEVVVNVPTTILEALSVTENGTYTPAAGHGYNSVNVNVQSGGDDNLFKKMIEDTVDYNITEADLQGFTNLKSNTFISCTHLKSIELPDSITTLPTGLFNQCTGLVSVKLPSALTEIPNHAFNNCTTLPFLDIPASVQKIGLNGCFASCNRLRTIICRAVTPPQVGGTTLQGMPSDCKIYVPDESVEAYKTAQFWSVRANYIFPLSEYTPS